MKRDIRMMPEKQVTEFIASLKERNAIQFDGTDPQGHLHLDIDATQALNVLKMLALAGQTFKVKVFTE